MKTITFYSYKGGVGRSLALSNIAIKLSQLKKKVFVVDFDLEAPGLQFKFDEDYSLEQNINRHGLVDYIYSFANENILPEKLSEYTCKLHAKNINDSDIDFLSAGNFENDDYWRKLATTRWSQLFYSRNSYGIRFFLDLKAKIEKEFNPDYLLIDSRTGITDISGITLKIFADEIVILAVNNLENLFGTKKIITSLTLPANELLNHSPKINFVLTRLPFPKEAEDKAYEYGILKRWEKELNIISNGKIQEVSIIHTDKQIHHKEIVKIGSDGKTNTITYDYLKLFEKLIEGNLSDEIDQSFEAIKEAEKLFNRALTEKDSLLKIELLGNAIELDPSRYEYFKERGAVYYLSQNKDKAINDFLRALEIKPNDPLTLLYLGNLYYNKQRYEDALKYLNKLNIDAEWKFILKGMSLNNLGKPEEAKATFSEGLEIFPHSTELLNARADLLRRSKKYSEALSDIYKAIEIQPDRGILFATLAEISLDLGKKEDFYLNLNLALSKNTTAKDLNTAKTVYEKVKSEPKFQDLLEKYQIRLEDVLI
jgi:tetratricopeptide (TPR) repeat protein